MFLFISFDSFISFRYFWFLFMLFISFHFFSLLFNYFHILGSGIVRNGRSGGLREAKVAGKVAWGAPPGQLVIKRHRLPSSFSFYERRAHGFRSGLSQCQESITAANFNLGLNKLCGSVCFCFFFLRFDLGTGKGFYGVILLEYGNIVCI